MAESERKPTWLVSALDQRMAQFRQQGTPLLGTIMGSRQRTSILMFLTEPDDESEEAFHLWNNACDHCGKVTELVCKPQVTPINVEGQTIDVVIQASACDECWELP